MTLDNTSKDEDRLDLGIAIVKYNNIINTKSTKLHTSHIVPDLRLMGRTALYQ